MMPEQVQKASGHGAQAKENQSGSDSHAVLHCYCLLLLSLRTMQPLPPPLAHCLVFDGNI